MTVGHRLLRGGLKGVGHRGDFTSLSKYQGALYLHLDKQTKRLMVSKGGLFDRPVTVEEWRAGEEPAPPPLAMKATQIN